MAQYCQVFRILQINQEPRDVQFVRWSGKDHYSITEKNLFLKIQEFLKCWKLIKMEMLWWSVFARPTKKSNCRPGARLQIPQL